MPGAWIRHNKVQPGISFHTLQPWKTHIPLRLYMSMYIHVFCVANDLHYKSVWNRCKAVIHDSWSHYTTKFYNVSLTEELHFKYLQQIIYISNKLYMVLYQYICIYYTMHIILYTGNYINIELYVRLDILHLWFQKWLDQQVYQEMYIQIHVHVPGTILEHTVDSLTASMRHFETYHKAKCIIES